MELEDLRGCICGLPGAAYTSLKNSELDINISTRHDMSYNIGYPYKWTQ